MYHVTPYIQTSNSKKSALDDLMITLDPPENSRAYYYGDGSSVLFKKVLRLKVSDSGTHRIETSDGMKHIVSPGWRYITIDTESWTL